MNKYYIDEEAKSGLKSIAIIILLVIVATVFGIAILTKIEKNQYEFELNLLKFNAIQLGYAEYNRTNGVWQFIEKK